jgi:hypothetical protein
MWPPRNLVAGVSPGGALPQEASNKRIRVKRLRPAVGNGFGPVDDLSLLEQIVRNLHAGDPDAIHVRAFRTMNDDAVKDIIGQFLLGEWHAHELLSPHSRGGEGAGREARSPIILSGSFAHVQCCSAFHIGKGRLAHSGAIYRGSWSCKAWRNLRPQILHLVPMRGSPLQRRARNGEPHKVKPHRLRWGVIPRSARYLPGWRVRSEES